MNLIFRILIIYYSFVSFFERKVFVKNIKREDLVLDVGSGDKPFWRADVIVDKYLDDDQQRHSGSMFYDKRKMFIKADVENLPFKNKVFDFVFCSHLLEHVENPDKAIRELTRVSKRGYIEVPSGIVDMFKPFPPHLWFCSYKDDILTFLQKEKRKNYFLENTEKFGKFIYDNPLFQYLVTKYQDNIFIRFFWKDSVKFKVIRVKDPFIYVDPKGKHEKNVSTKLSFFIYKFIYFVMTGLFYKKRDINKKEIIAS
jgi:SAM-dependent methyltransferase